MLRPATSFSLLLILTSAALEAADWPRFRGADGNASAASANVPLTWSGTENMAWKTEIPGNGASSATVFSGHVYLTSFTGYGLDPDDPGSREDLQQHVLCFDLVNGKLLWNKSTKASESEQSGRVRCADHPVSLNHREFNAGHGHASNTTGTTGTTGTAGTADRPAPKCVAISPAEVADPNVVRTADPTRLRSRVARNFHRKACRGRRCVAGMPVSLPFPKRVH